MFPREMDSSPPLSVLWGHEAVPYFTELSVFYPHLLFVLALVPYNHDL